MRHVRIRACRSSLAVLSFTTSVYDLTEPMTLDYSDLDSFVIFVGLKGEGEITDAEGNTISFRAGESVLLPATATTVKVSGQLSSWSLTYK